MPRSVIFSSLRCGAELLVRRCFFCELWRAYTFAVLLWAVLPAPAFGHKGHSHAVQSPRANVHSDKLKTAVSMAALKYEKSVKPIFQKSCYDCHSSHTKYPWYSSLPWVKGLIESDISEARTHLDLSDGYPFNGHGNLISDLEAIRVAIKEGSMPPSRYKVMHWSTSLSQSEKDEVIRWADEALASIRSVSGQKE